VRLAFQKSVPLQQEKNDLRIERQIPESGARNRPGKNHNIPHRQYLSIAFPFLHFENRSRLAADWLEDSSFLRHE
jgi:hypothetical protein